MKGIWRKLRIQWKLLILFTLMIALPVVTILFVVQDIIVSQLHFRQHEKITFAKNSVNSALLRSQRMAANYLTLISRDDAIKDSFYYAVRAKEVGALESEMRLLSLPVDYDIIIARDSLGESLVELGNTFISANSRQDPLQCESEPLVTGEVCQELWKWNETLFFGALAPVFKSRLAVEFQQDLSSRNLLGTLIIASVLDDEFARKIREITGAEVVIRDKNRIYGTSLPEMRKTPLNFYSDPYGESSEFSTQEINGSSYLTTSLPVKTKNSISLGEIIILADNDAIVRTTRRINYTIYLVSWFVFIIGFALAFKFSRSLGSSINRLSDGAKRIGGGDFTGDIEIKSFVELDSLARSLNSMSSDLKSLIAEKEKYLEEIHIQHEKIVEQKEYMTSLFESANDLIYVTDLDGKITFINQKIEEYGYGKEELLGKLSKDLINFSGMDNRFEENIEKRSTVYEVKLNTGNSKTRLMIFSSSLIRETSGAVTSELCILRDITDQKIIENNITHFDRLACTGRLAAGVAHEIGNPLTSVSSFLQLLEEKENDAYKEDCIKTIQKHINRICFTVERLKNLSRPHSLEKWSRIDVGLMIRSAMDIVRFDPRLRNVEIILDQDENTPVITGQGDQLIQVLINLILNSADAMNGSGKLILKTRADLTNNEVRLEIIDTGPGIGEESLDLIFDPFFTTKGHDNGTGLGLYVSQSIIQHHSGKIFVKDSSEKGTIICICLPVERQQVEVAIEQEV
ncbi:hypothetical protein MNBD_NITROSPINAE03-1390 [hydrothermal vent metagenome]|uniref:histidine kinase n=1 Tax=hydrothermal vent metagenome TaxID=652676 RepID=A0A3B1BJU1_9ZZZZ